MNPFLLRGKKSDSWELNPRSSKQASFSLFFSASATYRVRACNLRDIKYHYKGRVVRQRERERQRGEEENEEEITSLSQDRTCTCVFTNTKLSAGPTDETVRSMGVSSTIEGDKKICNDLVLN